MKLKIVGYICIFTRRNKISPQNYISLVEYHIEIAKSESLEFIVQSDLNNLNILWDGNGEIIGIVDFELITYTDRVEGLAWLIKWYSRPYGIGSYEMSPALGKASYVVMRQKKFLIKDTPKRTSNQVFKTWGKTCISYLMKYTQNAKPYVIELP